MAAENDTKTFFKLVKSQRKTSREQTDKLTVEGQVYESGKEICQACVDSIWPGKKHPLIKNVGCVSDVPRIHTQLKLVTGVYVLQVNRARFNQNLIDTRCQLCFHADETVAHFLLDCPVLDPVRRPALEAITRIGRELHCPTDSDNLLQLILDSSCFTNIARDMVSHGSYRDLDMQTRRLCHTLHIERYKRLALIPKRTRK